MQGCVKKIKGRIIISKRKRYLWKQFCGERYEFEGSYTKSGEMYQDDTLKDDLPYHKGIITTLS